MSRRSCIRERLLADYALIRTTRFSTFPDVLLVNAARFQIDNWVPRKVDVPLIVPHDDLLLDRYLGGGKQEGEVELPQEASGPCEDAFRFMNTCLTIGSFLQKLLLSQPMMSRQWRSSPAWASPKSAANERSLQPATMAQKSR